jgi:CheY-like chemotaxis protein
MTGLYKNILLIDDDDDDQEIFLSALENVDRSIVCTALDNATEALSMLQEKKINPDLIFLDLNMPIMNGEQFLKTIKKLNNLQDIPVIILSTSSHKSTVQLTKSLGAKDFVSKPDKFEDLINILRLILKQ